MKKKKLISIFLILIMLVILVGCQQKVEVEKTTEQSLPEWDMTYDVVVVGGGFAGLAAAYNAAINGADTLLVEKMPFLGGNSQINGGVFASYTSKLNLAEKLGYELDTPEKHIEDTLKGGDYMNDPALVRNMVYGAPFFLDLLIDNGLQLRDVLSRPGGHFGYRTHTTRNQVGADIVQVQMKIAKEAGVENLLEAEMDYIYREGTMEGRVVGIRVQTKEGHKNIKAHKGVILATGGFSGNSEMRQKHVPWLSDDILTTNHVGATGEGITLAQQIGANTIQMSYIQLYPFANPNDGVLDKTAVIPFSGPSFGIVYVDIEGNRYVNEGGRRDVCSSEAMKSVGFPTFTIFNEEMMTKFTTEEDVNSGIEQNRIFKADTLEELANLINANQYDGRSVNMPAENLMATIKAHNQYIKEGVDPEFGKRIDQGVSQPMLNGPYYAIPQWPSVHHTMGGLKITPRTEVEDIWGNIIPGLFAAGEITGGVHGTNRLGSNAIPDAGVHGLIAGQVAATGTVPEFAK